MNELIFNNQDLGLKVRTIRNEDGSISINAEDTVIGFGWYENKGGEIYPRWRTINAYLKEIGFSQEVAKDDYIPESLCYLLGMRAKNETAKRFQNWLAIDVIPSIRKHGMYATETTIDNILNDPDFGIRLLTELKEEKAKRKAVEEENKNNKPKVIFADAVATSQTSILVGELAKILKQNDIEIGEKRLFKWLRNNGYLIKRNGSDYNMPTQKSVDLGVIEIKERAINNPDGSVRVTKTPKVTGKGQQYFINKFLNNKEEQ